MNEKKKLCLVTTLLLMTITGLAEARPSHHSKNNHARYDRAYHDSYRAYRPVGHRLSRLPAGYLTLRFAGLPYYYNAGSYYQRIGHEYAVIRPPFGVGINILPLEYQTMYFGRDRYYVANSIFYRWDDFRRTYVVVADPDPGAKTGTTAGGIAEQYVYPQQGQSTTQTSRDRYECYLWAVDQSGVEPAQGANPDTLNDMKNYQRANGACLEARGYSVK